MRKPRFEALLFLISLAVLLLCGYYAAIRFSSPITRIPWDRASWVVVFDQLGCPPTDNCLEAGDQVVEVGGVTFEDFHNDRTASLLDGEPPYEITFRRNGVPMRGWLRVNSSFSLFDWVQFLGQLTFPLLFWLAGTLAASLGSPRDPRRQILIAFCYATALFFAAGFVAITQKGLSLFVVRLTGALFLPLAVHLHLMFPVEAAASIRRRVLPPLYLVAGVVALLDLFYALPSLVVYSLTGLGFVASLGLLAGRALVPGQPEAVLRDFRLLLVGSALGIVPWLVFLLMLLFGLGTQQDEGQRVVISAAATLAMPNWPLAFLYTLLRRDSGSFELRPNRAMGTYGFWSLYAITYLLVCIGIFGQWPQLANLPIAATVLISLPFVMVAPVAQPMFQRWLDHRLGIHFDPAQVVSAFASRIPTAFERESLRRLIEQEILPALLIRQSALLLAGPDEERIEVLSTLGVAPTELPDRQQLAALMNHHGKQLPSLRPGDAVVDWPRWIKLVVPLASQNDELGAWLLGRRDPDDDYPLEDRRQIAALANQIAAVVRLQRELDEKSRLQSQLVQSQKMEAVGRLSAGVAHDFNNFLSAILGYSELLDSLDARDPGFARYLGGIREAAEKASALTTQLLAFSRRQATAEQLIDLGELVERLENLLRRVLPSGIELRIERRRRRLPVKVDPGQLEQVLLNLVVNAGDAIDEEGRIEIATDLRVIDSSAGLMSPVPPGQYALMTVKDTGSGIAPEVLEHIFEPFFTTKKQGEGTGLGLAMVYGIVQRAGGYVTIETEVGRGTTFLVYLPLLDDDEARRLEEEGDKEEAADERDWDTKPGRGLTILLVEDEPNVRRSTADILRVHGFAVLECADAFAALELCDQYEGQIDLLMSDVMMPHLRGPELADRLLVRRPELRVLFISGYNEEVLLGQRLEKSGARLVRKPCPTRQLLKEIRASLDRS